MLKGLLSLIKQRHGCASALGTFRTSFASLASCAGLEPEGAIQLACSGSSRSAWANAETPSSVSGVFPASGAAAACILQQSRHFSEVLRHRPKVHKHDQPKTQPVKVVSGRPLQQGPTAETNVVPEASRASAPEVAGVVDHEALVITRNIEWGNVIFGFEQANKYTVLNERGETVALLAEELGGIGRSIGRQLLRTRRPMTATVLSPDGSQVIFRVRRSFYLINSTIYVEDGTGSVVGEVKQRWHLWQRNYELFLGKRQFAAINGGLLAWEFTLKDEQDGVLALIDRNFQGFGKELFTDAGKYVIHFGSSAQDAAQQVTNTIAAAHPDKPAPPVTALAKLRTGVAVVPTQTGSQLEVARQLQLSERMLALAAAVSIDFDYFSRHSSGGGGMLPFFLPIPMPSPPYPEGGEAGGASEAPPGSTEGSGEAAGAVGAADFPDDRSSDTDFGQQEPPETPSEPLDRDLGEDPFGGDFGEAGGGWGEQQDGDEGFGLGDSDSGGDGGSLWDNLSDFLRGDD